MIEQLERVVPSAPDRPEIAGADHPMRKVTRGIAFEPDSWTIERAAKVTQLFDTLAPEWSQRTSEDRRAPLRDALARGWRSSGAAGLCIEVGAGTGSSTPDLARHFANVVAFDLSREMLRRAPPPMARRVCADGSRLPIRDGAASCVVLVNCFLFPNEIERTLAPGGTLVWVSSLGDRTPIYLAAADVESALPGEWDGVAAEAGWGTWCALSRSGMGSKAQ